MPQGGEDPRRFGLYLALAQAGLEMVAPMGLGIFLDRVLGWTPWLTIAGAVGGFIGGLAHMITLAQRLNDNDKPGPRSRPNDPANRSVR
jgi:F0F1-type ATP synthase assembly protein I